MLNSSDYAKNYASTIGKSLLHAAQRIFHWVKNIGFDLICMLTCSSILCPSQRLPPPVCVDVFGVPAGVVTGDLVLWPSHLSAATCICLWSHFIQSFVSLLSPSSVLSLSCLSTLFLSLSSWSSSGRSLHMIQVLVQVSSSKVEFFLATIWL